MKRFFIFLFCTSLFFYSEAQVASSREQIAIAVKAAPPEKQAAAKVYGYNQQGEMVLMRAGSNEMICVADDPAKEGFQVVCYHRDLEPFMNRGNELRKEGKRPDEIFAIREKEAKAGTLKMPANPTTLHVLYGGNDVKYNTETDEVENARLRYVVYIPFATAESTGLPIRPLVPGGPWIMDPGTHRAHIMISPDYN